MLSYLRIRYSLAALSILLLGGCSVSPAVDAVSWTVDGVSYLVTGKSMTDHAVSAASGKDCAFSRAVKGTSVCLPRDEDVAGDRLVFEMDSATWGDDDPESIASGDPLLMQNTMAGLAEPLGGAVQVEPRSEAVAAVAAEKLAVGAFANAAGPAESQPIMSALIKDKSATTAPLPDRATRLWLPVEPGNK